MNINWVDVTTIVSNVSTAIAAIFAILGFGEWRKQMLEKRRIEVAEEVYLFFLKQPDNFGMIRHPVNNPQDEGNNRGEIVFNRLKKISEPSRMLEYKFLAYFGDQTITAFHLYTEVLGKVQDASKEWINIEKDHTLTEEKREKLLKILTIESEDDDELHQKLIKALNEIQGICGKVLTVKKLNPKNKPSSLFFRKKMI